MFNRIFNIVWVLFICSFFFSKKEQQIQGFLSSSDDVLKGTFFKTNRHFLQKSKAHLLSSSMIQNRKSRINQFFLRAGSKDGSELINKRSNLRRWSKFTKQVVTLGPASTDIKIIEKLFLSGADVFRLNLSHGLHSEKLALVHKVRELEAKYNHPICILADLQGPKLRLDYFENDKIMLVKGQKFRLDLEDIPGDETRVKFPHPELISALRVDDILLLDDGKLKMTVKETGADYVDCKVNVPGELSSRKGVNIPSVILPISPITKKDHADLKFALEAEVDWIALSFVQRPEDIQELKDIVGNKAKIMAKLEKPAAIQNLDDIVALSDGIMVARGDLGVEMDPEDVPIIQKRIISKCREAGKPVVVATQMLESMITSPTATRAETSDLANAVYEGADGIMLSAESAAGNFPVEAVKMQQRVINRVETDPEFLEYLYNRVDQVEETTIDAVSVGAKHLARTIKAKALVVFTSSGQAALRMSKKRPARPILAVPDNNKVARQLVMSWGIYPTVLHREEQTAGDEQQYFDSLMESVTKTCFDKGLVKSKNDLLVVTAGLPFYKQAANTIKIVKNQYTGCD